MSVGKNSDPAYQKTRWVCACCDRMRRTSYCEDCGAKAPDRNAPGESNLDVLRQVSRRMRATQQGCINKAKTLAAKPNDTDRFGYVHNYAAEAANELERAKEIGLQADAIEWAVGVIYDA